VQPLAVWCCSLQHTPCKTGIKGSPSCVTAEHADEPWAVATKSHPAEAYKSPGRCCVGTPGAPGRADAERMQGCMTPGNPFRLAPLADTAAAD
jgi:hypothetical protein